MPRWEPDAAARLQQSALELYAQRGYDAVTVAEIAVHAGLTKRTFFRHFADKREVLFGASAGLRGRVLDAIDAAPAADNPLDVVAAALIAVAEGFPDDRELVAQRLAIIAASPELYERQLIKFASMAQGVAEHLRARGFDPESATLAAESGIAIWRVAAERWVQDAQPRELRRYLTEALERLRALAGPA